MERKEFSKEKLGFEKNVQQKSGKVLIVSLKTEEDKREIIKGKNKLKGCRIFIEHDLSWEQRKRQENISVQVKSQKIKGL